VVGITGPPGPPDPERLARLHELHAATARENARRRAHRLQRNIVLGLQSWVMPYFDQEFGKELDRLLSEKFDLLLGWPAPGSSSAAVRKQSCGAGAG